MITRLLTQMRQTLMHLEYNVYLLLGNRHYPDAFCSLHLEDSNSMRKSLTTPSFNLNDLLQDSILWAVPKSRRTVEKRLNRKYGWPNQVWKPLIPKKNLLMCKTCGDHHEAGYLCMSCYSRIKKETEEMQETIEAELNLNPIEKDVIVLYNSEKDGVPDEFCKGKRIIEMKKERPEWFSKNLLEKTTKGPTTTTSIKPTDLA